MKILSRNSQAELFGVISDRSPFGVRDLAMLVLALHTGLRVAELAGLRVEHVCGAKPGGGRRVRQVLALPAELAKGGRPRDLPLNESARQAVLQILVFNHQRGFAVDPGAPLFPNRQHRAMSTRAVRRMLEKYCHLADLDQAVTPHTLRHSFASRLLECGGNTHQVQQLLGHVRLSSSQVYLHTNPESLTALVSRLN